MMKACLSWWLVSLAAAAVDTSTTTTSTLHAAAEAVLEDNAPVTNDNDNDAKTPPLDHGLAQIEWLRSHGGFVNSKITIRQDEHGVYGVFATRDIDQGDLLLHIPRQCLFTSGLAEPDWICTTSRNLAREMRLGGNASFYGAYIDYLNEAVPMGQLPSMWSQAGQELLNQVVGEDGAGRQLLPPDGPTAWLTDEWIHECGGRLDDDELTQHAFLLVIQRGWDDLLIPVYDMMSHRNNGQRQWLNTESNSVRQPTEDVQVWASRAIRAGEELYTSYTHCVDCGGRADTYGTPEMVRDYGFVEPYPQKYILPQQGVSFTLDVDAADELVLTWHSDAPEEDEELDFFVQQMERLETLYASYLRYPNEYIPAHELNVIRDFVTAYLTALERVVQVAQGVTCAADGAQCQVSLSRYSSLDAPYEEYDVQTCDKQVSLDFSFYDTIDEVQSQYQLNTFIQNPHNQNVCFDLDDIYQICGSYRPHYHEMVVHYTARFLPQIRRVLWVGGGDSMLLHEILKYPSLELVVGLELDQTVTRWAFKHFGSQPHWDLHHKVQWWYGDAAKSLLMLPQDYFGSFDMVLVDLSETVMSALVTKELDIMAALSLLLQPNGIFVKNELYFEKLNPIFKNTIQVHYYDVPVICSQCLCLGSHGTDFIHRPLTDHKLSTLFAPLDRLDQDYSFVHDYYQNPAAPRHCASDDPNNVVPAEQEASPGILLVLEAEQVGVTLSKVENVKSLLVSALENEGLAVVSTATLEDAEMQGTAVIVLQEGYVVARTWPQHAYVALDVHLWSRFHQHEGVKRALLAALRSGASSAFRIVAGGMFGLPTWRDDSQRRGPKYTQDCDGDNVQLDEATPGVFNQGTVDRILRDLVDLSNQDGIVAAVVCGPESEACHNVNVLAQHPAIRKVTPLHTCSDIAADNIEYLENGANLLFACENQLVERLANMMAADSSKINTVVLDPSASYTMARVVNKIVKRNKYKNQFLAENMLVLAPMADPKETWRKNFVDEFRFVIPAEPAFMSDLFFNTTASSMEIPTFLSGDDDFIPHLNELMVKMEQTYDGVVGEVRLVGGGGFRFQENFKASQWFLPKDYDQTLPYEQWHSQQPLGRQSLYQMESSASLSKDGVRKLVDDTLSELNLPTAQPVQEFRDIGDGSILVVLLAGGKGHVMALYDGRNHVSLNVFSHDPSADLAQSWSKQFQASDTLKVVLFDEMPRGYGRVVNFYNELEPNRKEPHWALHMVQEAEPEEQQ